VTERTARGLTAAVVVLAALLLGIRLGGDWRYLHDDNGAMQTTLALSHVKAGLAVTRGHDVFIDRETGARSPYGHHPPGVPLLLAGAFSLAGSAAPAVARSLVALLHLGSLLCVACLLRRLFPAGPALAGTLAFAILPMGAYFGRMVNYEAPCLLGVLLQLLGFAAYRASGATRGLGLLAGGIVLSGVLDWPAFFFAAAIGLVGALDAVRGDPAGRRLFLVAAGASSVVLALDLLHLAWAVGGSLGALSTVAGSSAQGVTPLTAPAKFLAGQVDSFRRYFSHAGVLASLLAAALVLAPRAELSRELLGGDAGGLRRRVLVASGTAGTAYVLAAPSWASVHPYWKFYFLPFVSVAVALLFAALGRLPRRAAALLAVLLLVEMAASSAYMLSVRHTREGDYAIEATAGFRARYLRPEDVFPPRAAASSGRPR
jgi:hypothetical protein